MSYCINPECRQRHNQHDAQKCQRCDTSLVINNDERVYSTINAHRYRIIKIIKYNPSTCTEIFEVEDLEPSDGRRFKILKAIHDNDTLYRNGEKLFTLLTRLFEREQRFLYFSHHSGIPKGYDIFSFPLSSEKKLHCLVMEKIEGVNLEEWVRDNGAINERRALEWLEQIVKILKFVNEEDFFHRDIKPSNIMWRNSDDKLVLIDFGAVKEINGTVIDPNGRPMTTNIGTNGYVAPEQRERQAVPQSDFYSLGRTFVYLLTGKHPQDIEGEGSISRWRESIRYPMSESLMKLINDLMEESPSKRPQNAPTILARLSQIQEEIATSPLSTSSRVASSTPTNPPEDGNQQRRGWFTNSVAITSGVVGLTILILIALFVGRNNQPPIKGNPPITPTTPSSTTLLSAACNFRQDDISCGEKSVISQSRQKKDFPREKAKGMDEIQTRNYNEAEKSLQNAWDKTFEDRNPDPETRIYLNNARIHKLINQQKNPQQKIYTIAVAAPLQYIEKEPETSAQGLEILRGVAQAQDEAIKNEIYLQVAIANDGNDINKAREIAEKLGKIQGILGVIGHSSSSTTEAAIPTYKDNKLVLISPASTAIELSGKEYFYRTVPNDNVAGQAIVDNLKNQQKPQKIAIFWSKNERFSESLRGKVEKDLGNDKVINYNIKNSETFNLASNNFNAENALNKAKQQGVTAIILIPDGGVTKALTNAYAVMKANKDPNLRMIGADTLYNSDTLKTLKENKVKNEFLIPIPWHPLNNEKNEKFPNSAQKLWRTKNVSWLTATAYDATRVLTEAIKQDPSREGVKKVISKPDFKVNGDATGEIRFNGSDRADLESSLVKVLPYCQPLSSYGFVPVIYSKNCISN